VIVSLLACAVVAGLPGEAEGEAGYADFFARAEAMAAKNEDAAAIALYREAELYKGTPESAKRLGKAYEKVGDTAFATLYYRVALARAPEGPDAASLAQQVGGFLGKAGADGKGLIEVFAARASHVTVQGRQFPAGPVALFVTPGEYEVEALFPSGKRTTRLRVKSGQVASINFEPVQPPLLTAEQGLPEAVLAKGVTNDEGPPANVARIVGIVALVVGVAAAAPGIALGVSSANDAAQARNTAISRAERQEFANQANAKALPANGLMIGGGAFVAGGLGALIYSFVSPPK
jgi:hypothetical protein